MEFPQVDLPVDMIAWTEVTEDILNIYKQSCRLKACIFALCIEGSITVSINLMDTEIKQGDFITLLPGTIIQFYEQKEKVCLGFVGFSSHCLNGVNLIQSTLSSFSNILEYPVLAINLPSPPISRTILPYGHASRPVPILLTPKWHRAL